MMSQEVRVSNWFQTSMTQNLWSSAWRTTRNYYLHSFLLRDSASLTDFMSLTSQSLRHESKMSSCSYDKQNFQRTILRKHVEVYKWCWCLHFECFSRCWWKVWLKKKVVCDGWIRKIKKRHVIDLENFFRDSDQEKEIYKLFFPASFCTNILNVSDRGRADRIETHFLL